MPCRVWDGTDNRPIPEEGWVQNKRPRDPEALFRTVPLPVHQILEAVNPATDVQDLPDNLSGMIVSEQGAEGGLAGGLGGLEATGFRKET